MQYDSNFERDEDHRFFVEIMRKGGAFYGLQEELLLYRRHESNVTNYQYGVDEQKTMVREILVPHFFPELTGDQVRIFMKALCENVTMTIVEGYSGLIVINKTLLENRSFTGENREEIRRILHLYCERLVESLGCDSTLLERTINNSESILRV